MFSSFFGKLSCFGIGVLGIAVICLMIALASAKSANVELHDSVRKWQDRYSIVAGAQQETEAENANLRKTLQELEASLSDWKVRYEQIQTGYVRTQEQLRQLRAENPGIREFLDTPVPFDLWRVLFPEHNTPGNSTGGQDGEGKNP